MTKWHNDKNRGIRGSLLCKISLHYIPKSVFQSVFVEMALSTIV